MQLLRTAAFFALCASSMVAVASSGFQQICNNISVLNESGNQYVLRATCKTTAGTSVVSSINLNQCVGFSITTGGLICEQNGGFSSSCNGCAGDSFGDFDCLCGGHGESGVLLNNCVGAVLKTGALTCSG